jgi:serine protease inhibitor
MSEHEPQSENIKALEKSLNEHMEICCLRRKVKRLKAEVKRFKTEVDRLCKAGDAMKVSLQANFNGCPYEPLVIAEVISRWRNATEGKQL